MAILAILLFFLFIPAAISIGASALLHVARPGWTMARRAILAAVLAGLVPVALPIVAVLAGHDGGIGPVVPVVALLALGLIVALVVGLPVALWIGRRKQVQPPDPNAFD